MTQDKQTMPDVKQMVSDMETIEDLLKNKGRFVGGMVHIGISDLANCIRADLSKAPPSGDRAKALEWLKDKREFMELQDGDANYVARLKAQIPIIDTLKAALTAPQPEDKWQPIETAPRDGTHIIVGYFDSQGNADEIFRTNSKTITKKYGYYEASPCGFRTGCGCSIDEVQVTHWQPITSPPKEKD